MADASDPGFDELSRLVQAELWSTDIPPAEPGRVSMPLADYIVDPQPGVPLDEDGLAVTREHVICKQALKPLQAALAG